MNQLHYQKYDEEIIDDILIDLGLKSLLTDQ